MPTCTGFVRVSKKRSRGETTIWDYEWPTRRRQAGSDRMLQNTDVPENSQRIGAGMPGVVTWGVIGGGDSARRFAAGLRYVTGAKLTSVWTRKREVAEAFAAHFGGATTSTLEQMLSGPVDAVYISTHPDSHHAYALAALAAGKHVLCEKPSMLNRQQLEEVLVAASIRGLLFMEAMKSPFFPLYRRLREHLEQDPIGQVAFVRAGSSIADIPLNHPIYNLDVGGGSLLGIGPYEAFLALDWLGPVERVQTFGQIGPTGIDTFAALQTKHLNGMAQLYCGVGLHGEGDALLVGPLGNVAIPSKWWNPVHATIRYVDGRTVELDEPFESTGFNYEVGHFCDLLRSSLTESPIITHDMSRQMMSILDHARVAIGLVYPQEL
jgi:scyllo-inositol 2-dehydrogenase (NADP+)